MGAKNRPGSAKDSFAQQQAATRRGAPGKRFIGETAAQSQRARREQTEKVERLVEVDRAERIAEDTPIPISAILAELVQDTLRLARSLVYAPFRIVQAVRRPREA